MNNCKNCGNTFQENFCNSCGQKWITKKFTLKDSISWLFGTIFNFEKGFLFTSKELIVRPGATINNFLSGITIRYAHPFRFLFIWATLSALLGVYLNVYEESGLMINRLAGQTEEQIERARETMVFMKQYMSFIMMTMVPFIAFGTYLITKRKGYNFAEHLIIISYGNSSAIIIGLPIIAAYFFVPNHAILSYTSLTIGMLVNGRVLAKTLDDHFIIGFFKYLLGFLIGFILLMILMVVVIIIAIFSMKALGMQNPFS